MATINQTAYDAMKAKGLSDLQIRDSVAKKYGQGSEQIKALDTMNQSKLQAPKKVDGTQDNTQINTPPKEVDSKNTIVSNAKLLQTPEQAKTQGVIALSPEQLKAKNLGTTTVLAQKVVTEQKNTSSLQQLYNKGYTQEQIQNQLAKKYGVGSNEYNKALGIISQDTAKKQETKVNDLMKKSDTTSNIGVNTLTTKKEDIPGLKIGQLETQKGVDLGNINKNFQESSGILTSNNAALLNLYGIDATGKIDYTNKDGIAYQIEEQRKKFEDLKNKSFKQFQSGRYQQVSGQIRQSLASRGIDVSKVPQEQLIALSGQIGQSAFSDSYNAKEKMINEIEVNNQTQVDKLNTLREKGLISANDLKKNIEALRQESENQKSTINKEYANAVFGIVEGKQTEETNEKQNALNTITTLGSQLGLSGTALGVLNNYINTTTSPLQAYTQMLKDLANKNSPLYKSVESVETAQALASEFANKIKLMQAEKSSSSDSGTKLSSTLLPTLGDVARNNPEASGLADVRTIDDYNLYMSTLKINNPTIYNKVLEDLKRQLPSSTFSDVGETSFIGPTAEKKTLE